MSNLSFVDLSEELINCKGDLGEYISSVNGEVFVDMAKYGRPQLVLLAYSLNNWNANQSISDLEHRLHYEKYIHPIHVFLEQDSGIVFGEKK